MSRERPIVVAITGMNAVPESPGPGLAVARCLREAYGERVRIVGLGYDALDPGLYLEAYCNAAHLISYPMNGREAFFDRLLEIDAQEHIDVLLPCLDAELPLLVALAPRLARHGIRTFLPDAEQLSRRAKDRLPELCAPVGVACPEIRLLSNAGFFYHCAKEGWAYPMLVKGAFYDARVVYNAEQAAAALGSIAAEWGLPVLAQKFVAGEEYNLTAVGDGRGVLLGEVMMKKRAVTAKGKAWAGVATFDAQLADVAQRLAGALRWKGPLEVEVMRDAKGTYHLIEINPRFPAWIYLSHGVGRNLPALLLELILGNQPPALPPPRPGTMFIRYAQETIVQLEEFESLIVGGSASRHIERSRCETA